MATLREDPLLGIARAVLTVLMGLTIFVGSIIVLVIPVMLLKQDEIVAEIATSPATQSGDVVGAILVIMAMVAAIAALSFLFLRHLRRIVDTVRDGDPFIPDNAVRLRAMAWLSIVLLVVAFIAGLLTMWLEEAARDMEANFDISIGGILLPLVLFILARVFRRGAEMREELEGTV